jgi:hypothetical protein
MYRADRKRKYVPVLLLSDRDIGCHFRPQNAIGRTREANHRYVIHNVAANLRLRIDRSDLAGELVVSIRINGERRSLSDSDSPDIGLINVRPDFKAR